MIDHGDMMPTPIYHKQIVKLRAYALGLNWFQQLFFPTTVMNELRQYSATSHNHTKAFKVYFALSQSNSLLDWIGRLFLSKFRRFSQKILTQTIINLNPLTETTFIEQIHKEERLKIQLSSTFHPPTMQPNPTIKIAQPQMRQSTKPPTPRSPITSALPPSPKIASIHQAPQPLRKEGMTSPVTTLAVVQPPNDPLPPTHEEKPIPQQTPGEKPTHYSNPVEIKKDISLPKTQEKTKAYCC